MALIDDVKLSLRLTTNAYDAEITDLIAAAKTDLGLAGVLNNTLDSDPLIKRAIMSYCKAHFGFGNADYSKLIEAYEMLKNHLSLSADYAFRVLVVSVKNASDAAIASARVDISTIYDGNINTYYTNESGQISIPLKVASNYVVEVYADGYQVYDSGYFDISVDDGLEVILDV